MRLLTALFDIVCYYGIMTILIDIIPVKARKFVYALFAFVGLVLGSLSVAGSDVTTWFNVYTFIGIALNLTAYANTNGSGDNVD